VFIICLQALGVFFHTCTTELFLVVKMVDNENLLNNKIIILFNLAEYPLIQPTRPMALSVKYQEIFHAILQDNC